MPEFLPEMPQELDPAARLDRYGPMALSSAELLALVFDPAKGERNEIRLAGNLLALTPYLQEPAGLGMLSKARMMKVPGLGVNRARQILCIAELSRRMSEKRNTAGQRITDARSAAAFYMERLRNEDREMVFCMMLDTRNMLIADVCISIGTVNKSLLSVRELYLKALEYHAVRIILVHNHPSGDPSPSPEDIRITEQAEEAGELIGIPLLDHIIIGQQCYRSLLTEKRTERRHDSE